MLASEERSGSEWLCQLMGVTDRLGRPMEYLNPHWNMRFIPDYPHDVAGEMRAAHRAGVTPNGVFSLKLHAQHFDKLQGEARLSEVCPHAAFVWLTREDRLGQAISRVRAQQSGRYHEHWHRDRPEAYDAQDIDRTLTEVITLSSRWERFFARNGVTPMKLSYERLQSDPVGAVQAIAALVGERIAPADLRVERELKVQRDAVSEEWRSRFLADVRDLDRFE